MIFKHKGRRVAYLASYLYWVQDNFGVSFMYAVQEGGYTLEEYMELVAKSE